VRFPGKSAPAVTASAGSSKHGNGSTFSFGVLAAMLVCAAAFLGIGASAASAATTDESYGYRNDVGAGGAQAFDQPFRGVAVSTDDDRIFLLRQADNNTFQSGFEVLEPDGTPLTTVITNEFLKGIAASPDGSAVYVLGFASVAKLNSDGAPTPTYTQDPLWTTSVSSPTDIAVDPSTGDVLMASGQSVVRVDAATGAQLSTIGASNTPGGPMQAARIAVASNGDVYMLDRLGIRVEHLGADGSSKGSLALPGSHGSWENSGIAVNPQNGDVALEFPSGFLAGPDAAIWIYTAANTLKDTIRVPAAVGGGNANLAFSSDGTKLYVDQPDGTAHVFVLGTQPGLDSPAISQITTSGFHLSSAVATDGEATTAHFEYCLASDPCADFLTADAPSPWHALDPHTGLENPSEDDPIDDDVTGLAANTDYLVRAYAIGDTSRVENSGEAVAVHTALGPPVVETGAASSDEDSAELNGTITTLGGQTTYHFEYGPTTDYGNSAPAGTEAIAGNLRTPRTFTKEVKGLQPGTTYHYRLVATNAAGTTAGADRTFTTLGLDETAPQRGYEQVTSPDKKGLALNGGWGVQVSPDGGAIEYSASAPAADAPSAAQASRYIARRGATDWVGQQPLDPPLIPTPDILNQATHALSDDFKHAMVVTPVALTPDAIQGTAEGPANIYVTDIATGAYHLVGTATQNGSYLGMDGTKRSDVFIGGARDFSWIVFISRYPLLPDAPQVAMYKWSAADGLSIVSLLPDGSIPTENTWTQTSELTANRLVSDDGGKVAFTLRNGAHEGVYRRSGDQTVAISKSPLSGDAVRPGIATGMSRDGRYVVFISKSKLTDDAADLTAQAPMNVYRYDAQTAELELLGQSDGTDDGSTDLIAMSDDGGTVYFNRPRDAVDGNGESITVHELAMWRDGQTHQAIPGAVRDGLAYASPNGSYIVALLGGTAYLYDADTDERTCLSCTLAGDGSGGQLPESERSFSNRHPQVVTDDGHAYFGTSQSLLSADHNKTYDVYEFYRGRLTLISPGDSDLGARLIGVSPDSRDVFFMTAQGLVGQDTDQTYDIYDARLGGGLAAQNPPPPEAPCAGDACQGAPKAPPASLTPGSAQLSGGTKTQAHKPRCAKNTRKVRRNGKTRCVKKKHHSKKRTAKHNKGAGR
jgi:hypothetical protein